MTRDLTIQRLNGTTYKLSDYDVRTLDFVIDAPEPRTDSEIIEGADGFVDLGTTYEGRTMRGEFLMQAADTEDYPLLRNEVFRIFASKEAFYLIDSREPGKRWLVKVAGKFAMEQVRVFGRFEVEFQSASAYSESINTTTTPFTLEDYPWQIGQGLIEVDDLDYVHSTATFSIYNAGDVEVNPRRMPLVIKYTGASTNLQIRNLTTLDTWTYTGVTTASDNLSINGTRSLKNGVVSVFANTNRKLITLAPGWNDFELVGASGPYEISYDFRFYYL